MVLSWFTTPTTSTNAFCHGRAVSLTLRSTTTLPPSDPSKCNKCPLPPEIRPTNVTDRPTKFGRRLPFIRGAIVDICVRTGRSGRNFYLFYLKTIIFINDEKNDESKAHRKSKRLNGKLRMDCCGFATEIPKFANSRLFQVETANCKIICEQKFKT